MSNPVAIDKLDDLEKLIKQFIEINEYVKIFNKSKRYLDASKTYNNGYDVVVKMKEIIKDLSTILGRDIMNKEFDGSSYFPLGILKSKELADSLNFSLKNYSFPDKNGFVLRQKIHSRKLDKIMVVQKRSFATIGEPYPPYDGCMSINGDEAIILKGVSSDDDLINICMVKEIFDGVIIEGAGMKNSEIEMLICEFPGRKAPEVARMLDYSEGYLEGTVKPRQNVIQEEELPF